MRKNYLIDSYNAYTIISKLCKIPKGLTYEHITTYYKLYGNTHPRTNTLLGRRPVVYIEDGEFKGWDLYGTCDGLKIISLNFDKYYDEIFYNKKR